MGHIAGHDFPYEIEETDNDDDNDNTAAAAAASAPDAEQDEDMDQVGGVRGGKKSVDGDEEEDGFPPPNDGDGDEQQQQKPQQQEEDEDFVAPMDDDEDDEQNLLTQPQEQSEKSKKLATAGASDEEEEDEDGSIFSLGLVNDVLGDSVADEDDPRQLAGDELVSSNSKWHAHTIKVYNMLKTAMAVPGAGAAGAGDDDDEGGTATTTSNKPSHLSFDGLSKNCSRRTAAGVFFELLQLKTWDYIDVDQNESFGNIIITPGPKFGEAAPSD
jgi:Conserved region of Rad21 / Rec8 like protein